MGIFVTWTKSLLQFALVIWPFQLALCAGAGFEASLQVTGGAYRVFRQGIDHPALEVTAWSTNSAAHDLVANFQVSDIQNRPNGEAPAAIKLHLEADGSKATARIPLAEQIGYYSLSVTLSDGSQTITHSIDLGIVWPPYPGIRPDSFFATNAPPQQGEDMQLLEAIGMKVQRTHFFPQVVTASVNWPKEFPKGKPVPLNFEQLDQEFKQMQAHGLWVLPIVGYSLVGAGVFDRTPLAERLGMYGPPNDNERFLRTWENILKHYPELTTIEFWNEPWTFGWTWAGPPGTYRQLQTDFCKMALGLNPHYRLIAGSSVPFVRDELEPFPDSWDGLLQGISHHPYSDGVLQENLRSGDVFRAIDEAAVAARDLGLRYAYLTEGGTSYAGVKPVNPLEPYNNLENAQKLVQYYVMAALAGVYMGNAQEGIGFGPSWLKSNITFATMTHFLEDRVPLVDIWPRQELLWGGIFADRKFASREIEALPRGAELSTRWNVKVAAAREPDDTKVAVIWGLTGASAKHLDTEGELVIADASDLQAYDLVGKEIPKSGGQLVLPLSPNPIYITTDRLDVLALRDRIQGAVIRHLTPVNFYALSLQAPASEPQDLTVRLQNQINRRLTGTIALDLAGTDKTTSTRFAVDSGGLTEVSLPWPAMPLNPDNRYPIKLIAKIDNDEPEQGDNFSPTAREQTLAVARFAKRTIRITGALADWAGLDPVTVETKPAQEIGISAMSLLNPNATPDGNNAGPKHVSGQVYTAYDDDFVYLGAAVHEEHFYCSAGQPFVAKWVNVTTVLPYLQGEPAGLRYPTECGSVFQFSFGFRDRVPNIGRQINDPWAWKGTFYDTDYSYVAQVSATGDQLVRIWGPDTGRRNGYQTESVPGIGPVPGAEIKITRDEPSKTTLYEIAIPRQQLALFDPDNGQCRFGFNLYSIELPVNVSLSWSETAGVFDYWQTCGSFPPTWKNHLACQTFFGIEK
jgi:hypothetical protein